MCIYNEWYIKVKMENLNLLNLPIIMIPTWFILMYRNVDYMKVKYTYNKWNVK